MSKYLAEIGGHSWKQGPKASFATITEAREWAESYGTTADWCAISDRAGKIVASHWRYRNSSEWFKAKPSSSAF